MWRITTLHRTESRGGPDDVPSAVPDALVDEHLQPWTDGVGTLLHRTYQVDIDDADLDPEQVIDQFGDDPNSAAPAEVAVFEKTLGEPGRVALGDEFVVRMPGPWDGPVRVVALSPGCLRLATLRGHLEAGQIEFRAQRGDGPTTLVFTIESWARPGDRLSDVLYNALALAKEIQLNLWTETCLRMVARAGGSLRDGVHIRTRWVAETDLPHT